MEFSKDNGSTANNRIESYSETYITINGSQYDTPLVVFPRAMINPWEIGAFPQQTLKQEAFEAIVAYQPQVILLGTGKFIDFPKPAIYQWLASHSIGLEVMTTAAACRTYMLLMAEGRQVAAALIPPEVIYW